MIGERRGGEEDERRVMTLNHTHTTHTVTHTRTQHTVQHLCLHPPLPPIIPTLPLSVVPQIHWSLIVSVSASPRIIPHTLPHITLSLYSAALRCTTTKSPREENKRKIVSFIYWFNKLIIQNSRYDYLVYLFSSFLFGNVVLDTMCSHSHDNNTQRNKQVNRQSVNQARNEQVTDSRNKVTR